MSDTERQAFEAWISAPPYEKTTYRFSPDASAWAGQYDDYQVQLAWEAWQARAAAERLRRTKEFRRRGAKAAERLRNVLAEADRAEADG